MITNSDLYKINSQMSFTRNLMYTLICPALRGEMDKMGNGNVDRDFFGMQHRRQRDLEQYAA